MEISKEGINLYELGTFGPIVCSECCTMIGNTCNCYGCWLLA